MTERYHRPALIGREPPPRWLAVVRFRLAAGLALLLAGYVLFLMFHAAISNASSQDPGVALCQHQPQAQHQGQAQHQAQARHQASGQVSGTDSRADVPPPLRCATVSVPAS